ncbi:glycoside hydrolase family 99-like domain-containing protein [Xanthobacter sp. V2C-8]|uniref:glycosyltransferase WbsX family protein n=1 Tax=Xanthobacter albus TaxID=3119929 RepID=UPI00372BD3E1
MNDLTHAKDELPAAQPPQEDRQAAETRIVTPDLSDLESPPHWRGAADIFTGTRIVGWVVSTRTPMRPVALDVFLLGEKVLTDITSELRPDIAAVLRLPVKAGYDIDLLKMSPVAAQAVMKRLKAESRSTLPVGEILELRIADTDVVVRLSDSLRHEEMPLARLAEILAPLAGRFEGDQSGMIRLRDRLLEAPLSGEAASVDVLAYYLPQFHPFPENDTWWGKGFSEWTNVTTAKPLFDGHYQPHLPADLGFYDLRLDQVQRDQVALAKRYGIRGFCYYYYWFSGQTLMTLPIDRHVDLDLDLDFCLCWANESWSRRWDGSEADVLMAQRHTFDSDIGFIRSCIRYFRSDRYIKIDGAPLIQVYRISLMERPRETLDRWREIAREEGFPDLHICMVESFGLKDPYEYGCDSSCEFPPHGVVGEKINGRVEGLDPRCSGTIYDYAEIVRGEIARPTPSHPRFRTAMPSWDNTARKGTAGNVFAGATPALFETWMRHLVADACKRLPEGQRLVFVNAWNEWAEGAHLEPDRRHGHANLRAVRNALAPASLALAPLLPPTDGSEDSLSETRRYVEGLIRANQELTGLVTQTKFGMRVGETLGFARAPASMLQVDFLTNASFNIERLNGRSVARPSLLPVGNWQSLGIRGWFAIPNSRDEHVFLALRGLSNSTSNERFIALITQLEHRPDVIENVVKDKLMFSSGFTFNGTLTGVSAGQYEIELLFSNSASARKAIAVTTSIQILIG